MGINAVKGVEIGAGFASVAQRGSEHGDEILPEVGPFLDPFDLAPVDRALRLADQPFPGTHEESAAPAGGVDDGEILLPARVWFHNTYNRLDERARREILAGPLLPFGCGLFQQPLERLALHVDVERSPLLLVDHGNELLEVDGIVEPGHGLGEDVAQQPLCIAKFLQDAGVMVDERLTGEILQASPAAPLGNLDFLLVGHLQEQQVRELFDVIPVIDAVVAQRVTEAPEFVDDIRHRGTIVSLV
ncbi:MAG: Chorismate synthase [bacterium ADurb.Bin374]|nr:MAG: Chorismate synthase [bacterium ADurb.Bin374]